MEVNASEEGCKSCGWSSEMGRCCSYTSNVKFLAAAGKNAALSLGNIITVKDKLADIPNFETITLKFLQENTTIPVPTPIYEEKFHDQKGVSRRLTILKHIPGFPLIEKWAGMTEHQQDNVAYQTAQYLNQLRQFTSFRVQSLSEDSVNIGFLFPSGCDTFPSNDEQVFEEITKGLAGVDSSTLLRLRKLMPATQPFTLTHGDLNIGNIIVDDKGDLAGIIDWETAGYLPVWAEWVLSSCGAWGDDLAWRRTLEKHMEPHDAAYFFLKEFVSVFQNAARSD